ncbi:MAG: FAD binding domain-containing protein [Acidimicrobiia bacterium]
MATDTAEFLVPAGLSQALEILAEGRHTVLAGGTDFYPARVGRPLNEPVIDITGIDELRGITRDGDLRRIGALTSWSEVIAADLPRSFDGLKMAAAQVGGVQIQNAGTIGGNLCNASPAADGVPPLLALDASVELASAAGTRVVPLEEFLVGYRETALQPGELVAAVLVPSALEGATSDFLKLGARKYLVISIVMVAVVIALDNEGRVEQARVAVGACSPVAQRARRLESELVGRRGDLAALVSPEHLSMLSPIDDIRAGAADRLDAALQLVRRSIMNCVQ